MLKFKRPRTTPPGGRFFYLVPETGFLLETRVNLDTLVTLVHRHYEANALPPPADLAAKVEDYICRNVADGFCDGDDEGLPRGRYRNLTFWQVVRRTEQVIRGATFVSRDTAEARADVCLRCTHNLRSFCLSCDGLRSHVQALLGSRSMRLDDYLGVCGLAGTVISGMAFLTDPASEIEGEQPPKCWLRKTNIEVPSHGE